MRSVKQFKGNQLIRISSIYKQTSGVGGVSVFCCSIASCQAQQHETEEGAVGLLCCIYVHATTWVAEVVADPRLCRRSRIPLSLHGGSSPSDTTAVARLIDITDLHWRSKSRIYSCFFFALVYFVFCSICFFTETNSYYTNVLNVKSIIWARQVCALLGTISAVVLWGHNQRLMIWELRIQNGWWWKK